MHNSSYLYMSEFKQKYVKPGSRVVEAGSAIWNEQERSYRSLFTDCEFVGTDLKAGAGVDAEVDWESMSRSLAFVTARGEFDVLISGQMLEHCRQFWEALRCFSMAVKSGGLVCIIVPSKQVYHDPPDYWRFQRDSVNVWAELMGADILSTWGPLDEYPGDLGGVFRVR